MNSHRKNTFKENSNAYEKYDYYEYSGNWYIRPFSINVPPLYSLKTSVNRRFSDVFSECTSGTLVENRLNQLFVTGSYTEITFSKKIKELIAKLHSL